MSAESGPVAVLGASGLVGPCALTDLQARGVKVFAYSRARQADQSGQDVWRKTQDLLSGSPVATPLWLSLAPIWVLPEYFQAIEASGAKRVVALSSTSRFTKLGAGDEADQITARRLVDGERALQAWAEGAGIEWVVLRPTLIYGFGRDRNVGAVASFIRRFGFFPLLGKAEGLRQPLHAADLASVAVAALDAPEAANSAYNLSGGETIPYRVMVERIFDACGRPRRRPSMPLWAFRYAVALLRVVRPGAPVSIGMAERMNVDMVFDHGAASRDLGFAPRPFVLNADDLP